MMKRGPIVGLILLALALAVPVTAQTTDPSIIVFYEEGCPSCVELEDFLAGMTIDTPEGFTVRHEIHEPGTMELLAKLSRAYDIEVPLTVPVAFVGEDVVIGMGRTQEFALRNAVGDCVSFGCESPIARLPISQLRTDLPRLGIFLAAFLALVWLQLR